MEYTMTNGNHIITADTATGDITGSTYQMRQMIKDDLHATWCADRKVWHSDKLAETIAEYASYLARCYKLAKVDGQAVDTGSKAPVDKTVVSSKMVNGSDGFYMINTYSDGSHKKIFVG